MSGLSQAAADARARADVSLDPGDHALANALERALDAEAREQMRDLEPEPPFGISMTAGIVGRGARSSSGPRSAQCSSQPWCVSAISVSIALRRSAYALASSTVAKL